VNEFLDRVAQGMSQQAFVAAYPHPVLVEVEATPQQSGSDQGAAGATELLDSARIRKESLSSAQAHVYAVDTTRGPVLVGRAPHCQLAIDHGSISKEHARLSREDGGRLMLEDLGSTNGTFHNYNRLEPKHPVPVEIDDAISFGRGRALQFLDAPGFYDYLKILQRFAL
jgi:pSer/pThr/pTyr-binding forkhead associated (FHA) protein